MERHDATEFAEGWIRAWNHRDVDAALSYFADDAVFTSLTAKRVIPSSEGVIRGKDALAAYWRAALLLNPALRFELIDVFVGVDTVAIQYANESGRRIVEVFKFENGKIVSGHATQA